MGEGESQTDTETGRPSEQSQNQTSWPLFLSCQSYEVMIKDLLTVCWTCPRSCLKDKQRTAYHGQNSGKASL